MPAFAIKAALEDPAAAAAFAFTAQKTMYAGKRIAPGDTLFVFSSSASGPKGLVARAVVEAAEATPRLPGVAPQTPRVSVAARRTARARRPLGRDDLKAFTEWNDGGPQTELNFKLYRQATDKIVGLSAGAAAFLDGFFLE